MLNLKRSRIVQLFIESGKKWSDDNAARLGAAVAYYAVFSIGPMLIIGTSIAATLFGDQATNGQLADHLRYLLGDAGAKAMQALIQGAQASMSQGFATAIGIGTLVFAATGVLVEMKDAMNLIWAVKPKTRSGAWSFLRRYVISLGVIVGIGLLVAATLAITATIAVAGKYFTETLGWPTFLLQTGSFAVSMVLLTLVFAGLYKIVPDASIAWRDVWIGAAVTALLFNLGKLAIGLYIGRQSFESSYGAAGSVLGLLVWIYYSAQILFFGAEFTHVYAHRHGSRAGAGGTQWQQPLSSQPA